MITANRNVGCRALLTLVGLGSVAQPGKAVQASLASLTNQRPETPIACSIVDPQVTRGNLDTRSPVGVLSFDPVALRSTLSTASKRLCEQSQARWSRS